MASQAKEVEMLSTEELQRNQQLISQIYTQEVRNSQQSGTSFLQAMCKGVSLSYCSFYRPPNYQDSSHLISKFTHHAGERLHCSCPGKKDCHLL
jgi:hypothetical protein